MINTNAINSEATDEMVLLWKAAGSGSSWALKLGRSGEVGAAASPKRFSRRTPAQLGWKAEFSLYQELIKSFDALTLHRSKIRMEFQYFLPGMKNRRLYFFPWLQTRLPPKSFCCRSSVLFDTCHRLPCLHCIIRADLMAKISVISPITENTANFKHKKIFRQALDVF